MAEAAKELLLTTEKSGVQCNVLMTDLHTGTTMKTFKDDSSSPHSLCILDGDYIVSAVRNKPLIYTWSVQPKEKAMKRLVAPGIVHSLAITHDGNFLVASVAEKMYTWNFRSGDLLSVLCQHHQTVTTLKFTDDSSHLISAGEDNLIMTWEFDKVVQRNRHSSSVIEPRNIWTGHSLPITDIYCGNGGVNARIASVSIDHTCKLWDLLTGQILVTFLLKYPITSVIMDTTEMHLFLGCSNGEIHKLNLHEKPLHSVAPSTDAAVLFGHTLAVRCLCVSLDGSLLISGSDDENVMVWDIISGQCVQNIVHKGPITNLMVTMTPSRMLNPKSSYPPPMVQLKKSLANEADDIVQIGGADASDYFEEDEITSTDLKTYMTEFEKTEFSKVEDIQNIQDEMKKLKEVCQKVYEKCVKEVVK